MEFPPSKPDHGLVLAEMHFCAAFALECTKLHSDMHAGKESLSGCEACLPHYESPVAKQE